MTTNYYDFDSPIDMGDNEITGVKDGVAPSDAVNVAQLGAATSAQDWKNNVQAASSVNVDLNTPDTVIDDHTLAPGRILLMGQTAPETNGLYYFLDGSTPLVRTDDANTADKLEGAVVPVLYGTAHGDNIYHLISHGITLETTSLQWEEVGAGLVYTGENGVDITGSVISGVAKPDGGLAADVDGFFIDPAYARPPHVETIGDDSSLDITVTHGLNTYDVDVTCRKNSAPRSFIAVAWEAATLNTVVLHFTHPPTVDQFRVKVSPN